MRLRAAALLLAVACVVASASASPAVVPRASPHALALVADAQLPVELAATSGGSATLNANGTGASSTVDASLFGSTHNVTVLANLDGASYRIRLAYASHTGSASQCQDCEIRLAQGATTSSQIRIQNGAVTSATGAWQTLDGAGSGGASQWWLHLGADTATLVDTTVTVRYHLEIAHLEASEPSVVYTNLTARFRV